MPSGYGRYVEKEVDKLDLDGLKKFKEELKWMGAIKASMVQNDIETHIFKGNFQNVNF